MDGKGNNQYEWPYRRDGLARRSGPAGAAARPESCSEAASEYQGAVHSARKSVSGAGNSYWWHSQYGLFAQPAYLAMMASIDLQPARTVRRLTRKGHELQTAAIYYPEPEPSVESREVCRRLFSRYWHDVQHLNSFSPEAARALLRLEQPAQAAAARSSETDRIVIQFDEGLDDPWVAVQVGLRERAQGRVLVRG